MLRKTIVSAVLAVVLILVGRGVFSALAANKKDPERQQRSTRALIVRALQVTQGEFQEKVTGYGQVRSLSKTVVSAEVMGLIKELPDTLLVGQTVNQGDLLCRLDSAVYQTRFDFAKAKEQQAQIELTSLRRQYNSMNERIQSTLESYEAADREARRLRKLVDQGGAISVSQLDSQLERAMTSKTAWLNLKQQKDDLNLAVDAKAAALAGWTADLGQAQINLERCTIRAPYTGQVMARHVSPGTHLNMGSPVVTLINPHRLDIQITVAARHAGLIKINQRIEVTPTDGSAVRYATVQRIAPEINEMNRTLTVYLKPENPAEFISGQTVQASIPAASHLSVMAIPRQAFYGELCFVAKRAEGTLDCLVETREPTVLRWLPDVALVTAGLSVGDWVVMSGLNEIDAGSTVHLAPEDISTAAQ